MYKAKKQTTEEQIQKYVCNHPFDSYEKIIKMFDDNNNIQLYAEYGELNHMMIKTIYENPFDEAVILESAKKIYDRGGFTALQANYYVLVYAFSKTENSNIKLHHKTIAKLFPKICPEWIN